ncbi:hypothetical protein AADY61_004218 [Salmonella enterica]
MHRNCLTTAILLTALAGSPWAMAATGDELTDGHGTVSFSAMMGYGSCVITSPPDVTFSFGAGNENSIGAANSVIASKVLIFTIEHCGATPMLLSASTSDYQVTGNGGKYAALTHPEAGNHSLWYRASLSTDGGQQWSDLTWNSTGTPFTVPNAFPEPGVGPNEKAHIRLKIDLVASGQTPAAGTYRGHFTYTFTYK